MPAYVPETIIWTCVAAFVFCVIAGLLMIVGVWEPKDPAVKKWLRNGVIISIVGAVAAFGVRQFAAPSGPPSAKPVQPPTPKPRPSVPPREPISTEPQTPPADETPSEPTPDAPQAPAIPADLQAWVAESLGPRPVLRAHAQEGYPSCVSRLRNAGAAPDSSEVLSCRRDLQKFHMDVIVTFYDAKRPYDHNLEAQEAALRKAGLQAEELPKYNFIIAEMDRLNGAESAEENVVRSLEERVLADIRRCAKSGCR